MAKEPKNEPMESSPQSSTEVADIQVERNRKKDREGRLINLAKMYVRRESENGPFYATLWLFRELNHQGVESIKDEVWKLQPYIEKERKDDPNNPLGAA